MKELFDALVSDASVVHHEKRVEHYKSMLAILSNQASELHATDSDDDKKWHAEHDVVLALWEAAFSSYIIFGRIRARSLESLSITIAYTQPIREAELIEVAGQPKDAKDAKTRGAGFKDWMRFVLNIQPYVFRFPLLHELATQSYHLRFVGARDHFVTFTRVIRKDARSAEKSHLLSLIHI